MRQVDVDAVVRLARAAADELWRQAADPEPGMDLTDRCGLLTIAVAVDATAAVWAGLPVTVRDLVESIKARGILNPLRVRPAQVQEGLHQVDGYEIVAGLHRYRSAIEAEVLELPCVVSTDDDLEAEIVMLDENLCRAELSPAERAKNTARRKAIFEELHPEARHGGDRRSNQVDKMSTRSFDDETADATGKDVRTIRRDAERGQKISERALALVAGSATLE